VGKYMGTVLGRASPLPIPILQNRPELLFVPLTAVCFLLSLAPFAYGWGWGQNFVHYLIDPTANQISPITWSAAWVCFGITFLLMRLRTRLNALRCAMVAASIPFGATGLFEIVFQAIGVTIQPQTFHMGLYDWFAISLWMAIGITGLPFWRMTSMFWFSLSLTLAGFCTWVLVGYPQVGGGSIGNVLLAYAFNGSLKIMMFVLFMLPIFQGISRSWVAKP
jgi:hypothetical protein